MHVIVDLPVSFLEENDQVGNQIQNDFAFKC